MNPTEALSFLEAVFAYEGGATDSGIRDRTKQAEAASVIDALPENDLRWALSCWVRSAYLSDEALEAGYGWEDTLSFLRWIDDGEYR